MTAGERDHGFTRVDELPRPASCVECLDTVHAHPFYREYKARVREILQPRSAGLYLEVGAGVGTDARIPGVNVIALDRSLTMCREARARGQRMVISADAEAIPLPADAVDGCWADRTFQHLEHPAAALRELTRVMKPAATIVVVDPDYGTQAMEFPDRRLADLVFSFRAHSLLRNGTLAHQMPQRFVDVGLEHVRIEEHRLVVRDPASLDGVLGLRSWARTAAERGKMTLDEAGRWESLYDQVVAEDAFCWFVSFFISSGRKPR
jgi:SAM-dependent methyltransferase